jgi:hypothetical protein
MNLLKSLRCRGFVNDLPGKNVRLVSLSLALQRNPTGEWSFFGAAFRLAFIAIRKIHAAERARGS